MSIQLYGHYSDYGSFANVSRAITNALRRNRFDISVYGVGSLNQTYLDVYAPIALNNSAHVSIYIGYPEGGTNWLHGHTKKVLVTVCETDRIPNTWVDACNQVDLVIVPSEWCRAAFVESGVRTPVEVVRHGVDPVFAPLDRYHKPDKTLMHVSGSLTFAARKGTAKVLRAFKRLLEKHPTSYLLLQMPQTNGVKQAVETAGLEFEKNVDFYTPETINPSNMANLMAELTGLVQPSRAEGFGICPVEARCVGTPVAITNATGHTEHFAASVDVEIPTGRFSELETQGNPVGRAPTISENDVYEAMKTLIENSPELHSKTLAWATENAEKWRWDNVLRPFIKLMKDIDVKKQRIRLGASAGLRGVSDG